MIARFRPLLLPAALTLVVGALLVGLGGWQLHRLAWKEAILARIEARTKAAPQTLPPRSDWASLKAADYEYRRVSIDGSFRRDDDALVFHGSAEGPGYLVLTPLDLEGGGSVIVNRGFLPADMKNDLKRATPPNGPIRVTGLMRPPEARNLFTPADEPSKNLFFTRDPQGIAAHLGLSTVAPFTVDMDAGPKGGSWPRGGTTELAIPNNHLSYALTWFGLALGLAGVFAVFAWRRLSEAPEGDAPEAAATVVAFRR